MRQRRPHSPRKLLTATLGLAVVSHLGTTACGGQTQDAGNTGGSSDGYGTGAYTSGNLVGPPGGGGVYDGGGGYTAGNGGSPVIGTGAFTSGNLVAPGGGGSIDCDSGTAGEGGAFECVTK